MVVKICLFWLKMIRFGIIIKFYGEPVYQYKYIKTKVRDGEIKTCIVKRNMYYSCIVCIARFWLFDSVINFNKTNHPQVYLEECKYKTKKT